jgi:hypothetical protein
MWTLIPNCRFEDIFPTYFWASTYTTYKLKTQTSMPLAGFEPAILATKRPHTYALDRATTGIGDLCSLLNIIRMFKEEKM